MIQAALRGVIDFRKARLYDKKWQRHALLLLAGLREQLRLEFAQTMQRHLGSLIGVFNPDKDKLMEIQEKEIDLVHEIYGLIHPWEAKTKEDREKLAVRHVFDRWQRRYGKLSEKETQERIDRTAEALRQLRKPSAQESKQVLGVARGNIMRGAAAMKQMTRHVSRKGN